MDKEYFELEKRIAMLTGRVFALEDEVQKLKSQMKQTTVTEVVMSDESVIEPVKADVVEPVVATEPITTKEATPQPVYNALADATPSSAVYTIKQEAPRRSMESRIGKNLMGILASVLILFSIILFGGLLYPYISDAFKVIIMYLVSVGLATFGIIKMRKDSKYNTVFTAMSACGVSAVYVSTLITYFGYHMISAYLLLLIIALWLITTGVLSKLKSSIFTYICNIGLIIASFMTMLQWNENVAGIVLFFAGLFALFGFNSRREFYKDIYYFLQIPVMSIIFAVCYYTKACNIAALALLTVINIAALIVPNILYKIEGKNFPWIMVNTVMTFVSLTATVFMLSLALNEGRGIVLFVYFIITVLTALLYYVLYMCGDNRTYNSLFYVIFYMALAITPITYYVGIIRNYIGWPLLFVVLIGLGILKNNKHFRYSGYGLMLLSLFMHPLNFELAYGIVIVCIIAIVVYLSNHYCLADKYIITPIALLGITLLAEEGFNFDVVLLGYVLALFIFNSKLFTVNHATRVKENVSEILSNIYTSVITLVLPFYIANCDIGFTFSQAGNLIFATSSTFAVVVFAILLLAILLLKAYSMFKNDDLFSRIFLSVTAFLCLLTPTEGLSRYFLMLGFVAVILGALIVHALKIYRAYDKYIVTAILGMVILSLFRYANLPIPFILLAVLSMGINTKKYRFVPGSKMEEKISVLIGYAINAVMMFVGLMCIFSYEKPMGFNDVEILSPVITIIIMSLLTIALFIINTKKVLVSGIGRNLAGVYVCLKFTILISAILFRLEAASYIFSIVGLLLAILFIVAGFGFKNKAFRIYGLIVTMLSVFKLILFDIEYSSDILRPIGIFISGILCFVISFIYSKIEKQVSEKEREG